jgi:hypothetical protein
MQVIVLDLIVTKLSKITKVFRKRTKLWTPENKIPPSRTNLSVTNESTLYMYNIHRESIM